MTGGRIPAALQAIFMASNRGEEVNDAPKEADKVYSAPQGRPNSRIPFSLQAVFMASNQGQEVHEPPTDRSAVKVYRRIWRPRQRAQVSPWACLPPSYTDTNPQDFLDERLEDRGYLPLSFDAKSTAYYNNPTNHQTASYGQKMIDAVKGYDVTNYRRMIAAGLSPNACNAHGESLLHMVCRRGNMPLFQILLDAGVDVQQTDDYGRTPLHDCCWSASPSFEIARILLQKDPTLLFLQDVRGSLPLSYITKTNWGGWNKFLEHVMDEIFPENQENKDVIPALCLREPNTRPVPNPKNCIPSSLANMVATRTMHPYEVMLAMTAADDDATEVSTLFGSDDDDYSDSDDSDNDEEVEEDDDGDEEDEEEEEEAETDVGESEYEGEITDTEGEDFTDTDGEDDDTTSSYDDIDVDDIVNYVESLRLER